MTRSGRHVGVAIVLTVALVALAAAAGAAPPPASAGRTLFGATQQVVARETAMGRQVEVVRVYTQWGTGPQLNKTALAKLTGGGTRTLFISSSFPWDGWKATATTRNSDADPNNNLPVPYCAVKPVRPGTTTQSGKTWWRAIGDGDYDTPLRTWLKNIHDVVGTAPEAYVTLQHEADRLTKDAGTAAYQQCLGTPADYMAAWARMRAVANGTANGLPNLTTGPTGALRFVPVITGWGFWHLPGTDKALINPDNGNPVAGATGDDLTLKSARVTAWVPPPGQYDLLGFDVFNLAGAPAGVAAPKSVKIDDPATATAEKDEWRELSTLLIPIQRWATNFARTGTGAAAPLMLVEYGSVPDPTRVARRAQWLSNACTYFASTPAAMIRLASYFDVKEVQLSLWNWTKTSGGWNATSVKGTDTGSVTALGALGKSPRFGGTGTCS